MPDKAIPSGSITKTGEGVATRWHVRLTYYDDAGRRHDVRRRAGTKAEAERLLLKMKTELVDVGRVEKTHGKKRFRADLPKRTSATVDGSDFQPLTRVLDPGLSDVTFRELATWYATNHAVPPAKDGHGRRIPGTGLADWRNNRQFAKTFAAFFGDIPLRKLSAEHVRAYRDALFVKPTERGGRVRTIAAVNRQIAVLRRMCSLAAREGWMIPGTIPWGDFVKNRDEVERMRVLTIYEEVAILEACSRVRYGDRLRGILVTLIDLGLRPGEVKSLRWGDVDLVKGEAHIRPVSTKRQQGRVLNLTTRVVAAVKDRYQKLAAAGFPPGPNDLLFGVKSNVENSWKRVRKLAGVEGVHLHDLRHTAATRWAEAGMSVAEIGRLLGHSQISSVTYRYTNLSAKMRDRQREVAEQLEALRKKSKDKKRETKVDPEAVLIQRAIRGR